MASRIHAFPPEVVEPIWLFPDDSTLKAHDGSDNCTRKNQLFAKSNPATAMKSKKSSASIPLPSPQMKPATSLASARLTRSEIDSLRQGKKQIADYAQKALKDKVAAALAEAKS